MITTKNESHLAMDETPFRAAGVLIVVAFLVIRAYYRIQTRTLRHPLDSSRDIRAMRLFLPVLGILGLSLLMWLLNPGWLRAAAVPLPSRARWGGAGLAAGGLALLAWAHQTLGANFSGALKLQAEHQLITGGPYRWVRHPIYTAIVMVAAGIGLVTANRLVLALPLAFAVFFVVRAPREEAMLVSAFGDQYQAYQQRTGRFVPRLRAEGSKPRRVPGAKA